MPGITAELIMNKKPVRLYKVRKRRHRVRRGRVQARSRQAQAARFAHYKSFFRDQLDRYGTVAHPRDCIAAGLRDTPETIAVINADCPMAASVSRLCQNKTVYYGLGEHKKTCVGSGEDDTCPVCGKRLGYKGAQLRKSRRIFLLLRLCTKRAGCERGVGIPGRSFILRADSDKTVCAPALPGLYNVYNSVGAVAAAVACGVSLKAGCRRGAGL